ncbi:Transducin WD40 repeat-like superfamily [Micractinium conductrix]|uniref:Transducin WD40 repeat-like superfamily n=1 Tax=Micractinium conductrix TaxID=554055 RepID=A0A2P6V6I4_9CHLO|nr:Transducin WD40 repeat-like superfamily [Micractinium conductrix]|eukprot:PSC69692.1 Transducin WD40 repeat-like superfamily [Micractinium conductrix]
MVDHEGHVKEITWHAEVQQGGDQATIFPVIHDYARPQDAPAELLGAAAHGALACPPAVGTTTALEACLLAALAGVLLACVSPFVTKAEALLRFAGIPYSKLVASCHSSSAASSASCSHFIMRHLVSSGAAPAEMLHPSGDAERAAALAVTRMCDTDLAAAIVYERWALDERWASYMRAVLAPYRLPAGVRWLAARMGRRHMLAQVVAQGYGRHSAADQEALVREELAALSTLLGGRRYFFSDAGPHAVDAAAFGVLDQMAAGVPCTHPGCLLWHGIPAGAQAGQPAPEVDEGLLPHAVHLQPTTPLDGTLPGVAFKAPPLLAWHPAADRLLTASTAALVEYDAVSGARRNLVEPGGLPLRVRYTPSGGAVVLLTRERAIYAWSTNSWKRRVLLAPDPKYAGKKLAAGLLAISGGQHPVVYWTPLGKNTVRMVPTVTVDVPRGAKPDKESVPGVKLKTENKKPIVALAAHPAERSTIFVLLADGTLQVCSVAGAAMAANFALPIAAVSPQAERVELHAWPHPILPGGALLAVEAAVSGVSILEAAPRQEPRLLGTLSFGPGSVICGVGLLANGLLCAAGLMASGNVQVQAWQLMGDSREVQVLPTVAAPSTVWDALQSVAGKAALSDVSGESAMTRLHFHPHSGAIAVSTTLRGREGEAAHARVPLLHLVDGADPAGAPTGTPIHTGLGFWTARDSSDSTVSKLRFPRYAYVVSSGKVASYDLTHGMLADFLALPPANSAEQERRLVQAVRSPKQAAWLAFSKVLSRKREGAPLSPGQCEFSLVRDSEAALTTGQWMLPGAGGAFVGADDELAVVLSNSGRSLSVYDTGKLTSNAAKPLYVAELKEGLMAAVYPGPPVHIPAPPVPPPRSAANGDDADDSDDSDAGEDDEAIAARREWEAGERRRLEAPRLVLLRTQSNQLCLAEVSPSAVTYTNKSRVLPVRATLALRSGEAVVQVAWQSLMPADNSFHSGCDGAGSVAAAVAAVLTSQRLLLVNERLAVVASAGIPSDMGLPASCLWMGPALLVSTTIGQVLQVCWDGKLVHLCSLLGGASPALLGALADRLLIATRPKGTDRAEVCGRGVSVLQPLLLGWASLAQRRLVPGGAPRVRQKLRTLVASYDASHLGVAALERLASAGFADVAAAVASSSDSAAITLAHKAVFQAAAGDWQPLLLMVMQEWEQSTLHPGPPPRSSQLYGKMVALARSCQQYGRFRDARTLLEAAGAHGELLALCVFQGDFQGLQAHARQAGRDVERLADQLMAVNENAFVHGTTDRSLYGGRANVEDWRIAVGDGGGAPARRATADQDGADGDTASAAQMENEIEVAPAGRLPFQEASLQVLSASEPAPAIVGDEGQPIDGLDLGTLEAYVGVTGATVIKPAVSTPTAAAAGAAAAVMAAAAGAGPGLSRMETGFSELSNPLELGGRAGGYASSEGDPSVRGPPAVHDETAAQAAARADFRRDTADDEDDFFSSDDDSAPTEDSRSVTSMATPSVSGSQRFKIAIKSAEEVQSQPRAGDLGALRAAAQGLRLGGPGSVGGSTDSTPFGTSRSAASMSIARSSSLTGARPGMLVPPPAATGRLAKPPSISGSESGTSAAASAADAAAAAAPAAAPVVGDPFANLFGLGSPAPSGSIPSVPPPPPPPAPKPAPAATGPMRPQPPAPPAQTSLLAGWDDFEALFAAPAAQPAASSAPAAASAGAFGPVSFPPPPAARSASPPKPLPSPQQPKGSPAPAVAPPAAAMAAASGSSMKRSGSVSELAPKAAKQAVTEGLAAFAAGRWDAAATQFGKAVDEAGREGGAFGAQALQLFVAARLLAGAARAPPPRAARLARFAVALPLLENEPQQRVSAVAFAIESNMAAGNYGYAADHLTWLVIQATSGVGGLNAKGLQNKLNACDRAGGGNAALAGDEDRDSFAAIVSACSSRGEAEELVANIVNS